MGELYLRDNYRTSNILLYNTTIFEYDLKSANTSVAKEYKLLPEEFIKELEGYAKQKREVMHGLYKRDHKEYNELEKAGLASARKLFFERNSIEDNRIVAIKKDAIFVEGRCMETKLTENLDFRLKNEYTSYMYLNPFEIYYSSINKPLDVKGINDEVYKLHHHEYFGGFIAGIFRILEVGERKDALKYIRLYYDQYKKRELSPEHYREFTALSVFRDMEGLTYDMCIDIDELDIRVNASVITKILQILI